MRLRILLVCCAALALTVGVATATGSNSPNAKLCQKGGWMTLYRSDGSSFANQSECVSYGANGGTPTSKSSAQIHCEQGGGLFTTPSGLVWKCENFHMSVLSALEADCEAAGGGLGYGGIVPPDIITVLNCSRS